MVDQQGKHESVSVMARPDAHPIYVTRTFLPPREEYDHWLDQVYNSHQLTNNGPIHKLLEETLRDRFQVPHLRLMANGTLALQLAIRALEVTGEVITTPFSYVATTSAILWEGCKPVFVDIDPQTCCIDPNLIEAAITPRTSAILATHVYGIPCDVEAIDAIAKKHGLKVIYDAAHAFDVQYKGKSILQWGDASTLSFHATKLFHTVEGGAVVLHDADTDRRLYLQGKFGHVGDEHYMLGINAKMSEVHAAMGMAVLPHVESLILKRAKLADWYNGKLAGKVSRPAIPHDTLYNFAYYAVQLSSGEERASVLQALEAANVHPRRYFFPALNRVPYLSGGAMPMAEQAADRTICLPFYPELRHEEVTQICDIIIEAQ